MKAAVFQALFKKQLKRSIEKYEFQVGVLDDVPHYEAVDAGLFKEPLLSSYAGGPVRRKSGVPSDETTGQIFINNMERTGLNLLLEPFEKPNSDILKFTNYFLKLAMKQKGASERRVTNLLQAIVRNPILNQEYGANSSQTADSKGFNRHLFDTGQMFKSIKARITKGG